MTERLEEAQTPRRGFFAEFAFSIGMTVAVVALVAASAVGCRITGVLVPDAVSRVWAAVAVIAIALPLPIYWHTRGGRARRDGAMAVLWAALLWIVLPFPVDIAGRIGRGFPLRDPALMRLDAWLGGNVPAVAQWAQQHWYGVVLNRSYWLLEPMLVAAFILPGLFGHARAAKRLLIANLAAFAIGLPVYAVAPAVGPWYGYHAPATPQQQACERAVLDLRKDGPYEHRAAGTICFPSFHVMWALLCADALYTFRRVRWLGVLLAAMIAASTITSGWHYMWDVLGGLVLAAAAIAVSRVAVRT